VTVELVPPAAVPLASCVRAWDGQLVEFFVIVSRRRSHDQQVNGLKRFQPVAAVGRRVVWRGESSPNELAATAAAVATHRALRKEPSLYLIHAT